MSRVLNGYISGFGRDVGIYIGRAGRGQSGSPLANPYRIGQDGDRTQVIAAYRRWLWGRIQAQDPAVIKELSRIQAEDADVICFCAPQPCHGDVVIKAATWLAHQPSVERQGSRG